MSAQRHRPAGPAGGQFMPAEERPESPIGLGIEGPSEPIDLGPAEAEVTRGQIVALESEKYGGSMNLPTMIESQEIIDHRQDVLNQLLDRGHSGYQYPSYDDEAQKFIDRLWLAGYIIEPETCQGVVVNPTRCSITGYRPDVSRNRALARKIAGRLRDGFVSAPAARSKVVKHRQMLDRLARQVDDMTPTELDALEALYPKFTATRSATRALQRTQGTSPFRPPNNALATTEGDLFRAARDIAQGGSIRVELVQSLADEWDGTIGDFADLARMLAP